MMRKIHCSIFFILIFVVTIKAQKAADSTSLLYSFKKGKTNGHFRLYYMNTNNDDQLTDYNAVAFGGGLKYETKSFKGFQLGMGGFFIWNVSSSDLFKPDNITGIINRYEIGQFDQTDPSNKKDLQRLEDFYIKYNFKKSYIKYGKQVIKTPFINPQDGRMRPTGVQGFWAEIKEVKKTKLELGWLTHISPRGTTKWYRSASSMGIYPAGSTIYGEKSDYKDHLESKGTAIAGITYSPSKKIKIQLWDHWVENIFNTILLQADGKFTFDKHKQFITAFQYIHQNAVHKGGNADKLKTYFDPSQKVNIYGVSAGLQIKHSFIKLNYTRITKDGRFLFPREWGREPLFTFMARERNEGQGDVNAITINIGSKFYSEKLFIELSGGYYKLPDVKDFRLNKYGMPSYYHFNFSVKYSFDNLLSGLNMELLYLYKRNNGNIYNDLKFVINKVDMRQFNMVVNYNF